MNNNENLIPIPGRLHSVATEGQVAGADEIYDDSLQKNQATINQEVSEALGEGGTVDEKIAAAVNALDAAKSQTAGTDGLALSITEVDGKITSISGSIAANTYDANGAAATAKSEVLGSGVGTDYNTLKKIEDKLSPIETAVGTGGSIDQRIENAINSLDATLSQTAEANNGGLNLQVIETDGKITSLSGSINPNTYDEYGAASEEATRAKNAENELDSRVTTNKNDIESLQEAYRAITQSQPIPKTSDEWAAMSSWEEGVIYRVQGTTSYADYMYNGTTTIKMAEYDNAIDSEPTAGSDNLVKSGGVADKLADLEPKIINSDKYVKIELDKENRILSCTKTDGTKDVYLATDFINGLKSKGKDVITTDDFTQEIRDRISLLPNETKAEFVKVLLDSEKKLIESIDNNGNKTFYGDVSVEGNLYNKELKNVKENAEYKNEPFPSYKLHNFSKPIFCGDSVTAGYWVEGTEEHRDTSTGSDEFNRYPTIFGQFYPHMNITVKAEGGINCTNWYNKFYPNIDFSQHDLVVIELGYNAPYLNFNDIDVEGTNTNAYKKIVQGVRSQNSNAEIILVISSHPNFVYNWKPILDKFAVDYDCKVIDLTSKKYLNLDDAIYHGWGANAFDWAHFTRKGYRAKAYVVARLIADVLTDETNY